MLHSENNKSSFNEKMVPYATVIIFDSEILQNMTVERLQSTVIDMSDQLLRSVVLIKACARVDDHRQPDEY